MEVQQIHQRIGYHIPLLSYILQIIHQRHLRKELHANRSL